MVYKSTTLRCVPNFFLTEVSIAQNWLIIQWAFDKQVSILITRQSKIESTIFHHHLEAKVSQIKMRKAGSSQVCSLWSGFSI